MLLDRGLIFQVAFDATLLLFLRVALLVGAVAWAALFIDAWRLGQPLSYGLAHRRAAVGVNGLLCFAVAGTMLFGAHLVGVQRDLVIALFGDGEVSDPHDGRYNVLLLGGDSGAGRWGLRPDSMTIASIDADTGRTVLIGLPRNMANFPFAEGSVMDEQFPDGFDCEGCYLNGVSTWAEDNTELFGKSKNPGIDATIMAIEGITDLKINYWAMVNLEGFKDIVDAVGGVTLNVRQPIPVGGLGSDVTGYIQPGVRKLDGHDTLWYARAREGSDDYSRMARQKCVLNALLEQVSPQHAIRNFGDSREGLHGDPVHQHARLRDGPVHPAGDEGPRPEGRDALPGAAADQHRRPRHRPDPGEGRGGDRPGRGRRAAPPARAASRSTDSVTGGSVGSLSEGYAANQADDLAAAC